LAIKKQNVLASELGTEEQNVVAPKLTIVKQNVVALELANEEQNVVAPKLAIEEQNVVSELATKEQNVAALELGVGEPRLDETSIQCNLKLAMVIVSNPNGRLNYFKIYIN